VRRRILADEGKAVRPRGANTRRERRGIVSRAWNVGIDAGCALHDVGEADAELRQEPILLRQQLPRREPRLR
jgi:hypothetical protein